MYLALVDEICRKRPFSETGLDNEESDSCRKRPFSETGLDNEESGDDEDMGDGLGDQEFYDAFLAELLTEPLALSMDLETLPPPAETSVSPPPSL